MEFYKTHQDRGPDPRGATGASGNPETSIIKSTGDSPTPGKFLLGKEGPPKVLPLKIDECRLWGRSLGRKG